MECDFGFSGQSSSPSSDPSDAQDDRESSAKSITPIPEPTDKDLAWIKKFEKNPEEAFAETCFLDENLWRIRYALEQGVNIHYDNEHGLRNAAYNRQKQAVLFLIHNGADPGTAIKSSGSTITINFLNKILQESNPIQWCYSKGLEIHRRHYQKIGGGQRRLTTSFNFKSRKIMTTIEQDKNMNTVIERFSEQDTFDEIAEAHAELAKRNPDLPPLSEYKSVPQRVKPKSVPFPKRLK